MRAAVLDDVPGHLTVENVTVDKPNPHEVLVRIGATGLCHSDLHHIQDPGPAPFPIIPGHEAAGVVEALGSDVTYVAVGDHVVASPRAFCGRCEWCLSGRLTLCPQETTRRSTGSRPALVLEDGRPCRQAAGLGTFAEKMLVHENALVKIDPELALDRAALLGCSVITGVGAVIRTAKVPPGSDVAVIGCGGIGLNCIQGAVIAGADRIIAIDIDDEKLALARQFGATEALNTVRQDVRTYFNRAAGRGGVDFSFEALGLRSTIELSFELLRPGGTATIIGVLDGSFEIPGRPLLAERKVQGSMLGSVNFRRDVPYFLDLYRRGQLKLDELISSRLTLGEINDGFDALAAGKTTRSVIVFD